ncbi:hypothetical protein QFZ22_000045 [Streptomyces canus]|uniref:Uncharacterized protein n=1 Tax=Streptomyces canus TaxID=58343 RepID=A0AAW8F474_9ACTN|nr:hypothetical protein [Streptomyces canus]MDQ0904060.1 hypothetical protein [Streptomyces canus]
MLHRAQPRATGLRRARQDVGSVPLESLIHVTAPAIGVVAGFVLAVRAKANLETEAVAAGSPAHPLLPKAVHPGEPVGARTLQDQWCAAEPTPTA